jgi:transposase
LKTNWYDFSDAVADRLEPFLKEARSCAELRRIQAIYFRARYKDNAAKVAERTGLKLQTVRNLHSAWRHRGEAMLDLKPKGGRYHEHQSIEEEHAFIAPFLEDAKAGHVLEVSKIHRALEEKIGTKLRVQNTYNLLHRHGWRKITPRPKHPQGDVAEQEAFKKTLAHSFSKPRKKPTR